MPFMRNTKKKKHPVLAVMAGGLAVFGAYSLVSAMKRGVMDKMSCMINKIKNMKNAKSDSCGCGCDDSGACETPSDY